MCRRCVWIRVLAAAVVSPGRAEGGAEEGCIRTKAYAKRAASVAVSLLHCWPSQGSSAGMLGMHHPSNSPAAFVNTSGVTGDVLEEGAQQGCKSMLPLPRLGAYLCTAETTHLLLCEYG